MGISYSKEVRANAERRGKDVFACGFREVQGKGACEFVGPMDWRMAQALFDFAHAVYRGETPADAFAATEWPEQPPKERPATP